MLYRVEKVPIKRGYRKNIVIILSTKLNLKLNKSFLKNNIDKVIIKITFIFIDRLPRIKLNGNNAINTFMKLFFENILLRL